MANRTRLVKESEGDIPIELEARKALFRIISSCSRLLLESRDTLGGQVAQSSTLSTPQTCLITQILINEWDVDSEMY